MIRLALYRLTITQSIAENIIVNRGVFIKKYDYAYWSSPVANFPLASLSPTTLTAHLWKWMPTVNGNYGNWANANENMISAKGYIVRGPSVYDNITAQKYVAVFSGVPNNGTITPLLERGNYQGANYSSANGGTITNLDDNFNLIGNPYPSAIKALDFLTLNTNLEGSIRLWTHGNLPSSSVSNPYYGNFTYNYTVNDYITYNGTGTTSGPSGFNGYIASGQGFFVTLIDGPAATQTVTFNNSMRNNAYGNSQFYRVGNSIPQSPGAAALSGRIWLDLLGANGNVKRTLVGYIPSATLGEDRLYDSRIKLDNTLNFYSLIGEDKFCIQGRPLPFNPNDEVSLGFQSDAAGNYTIAIGVTDGIFNSLMPIYLKDNYLNVSHNLSASPYTFTAQSGKFDNRFTLLYADTNATQQKKLISNKPVSPDNQVQIVKDEKTISVESSNTIDKVTVYIPLGKEIYKRANIHNDKLEICCLNRADNFFIVKIELENGATIIKKVAN